MNKKFSPKLQAAMDEIKEILKKHDIAAQVILHTVGNGEMLMKFDTSYTAIRLRPDGAMYISTKDLATEKEKMEKLSGTVNMLATMKDINGMMFNNCDRLLKAIEAEGVEILNQKGKFTPRNEIDN